MSETLKIDPTVQDCMIIALDYVITGDYARAKVWHDQALNLQKMIRDETEIINEKGHTLPYNYDSDEGDSNDAD